MRNLLVLAIALGVLLTDEDVKHLGYDVTAEDFKDFFAIPEATEVDMENISSDYKHQEKPIELADLERYMTKAEVTKFKKKFPATAEEPKKAEETAKDPVADKAAKDAEKAQKAADAEAAKVAKQAEKDAAKAAKEAEKEAAKKAKEDAKAAKQAEKEAAKASKDAEKENSSAKKDEVKPLSRSQEIFLLHKEGLDLAKIMEKNPDWNKAHVRNALYTAANEADKVQKAVEQKAKYDAQELAKTEAPAEATAESTEVPATETESNESQD